MVELPGVSKKDIQVNSYDRSVEIVAGKESRKFRKIVELPPESEDEAVKCTFKDGLLEITFSRKKEPVRKGKPIAVE